MTTRFLFWLYLTLCLYGWAALGYRIANLPHFPLRDQTGDLVYWTDALIYNTGILAVGFGPLLANKLSKRIGNPQATRMIVGAMLLGFVMGWLISCILHKVNPSLYHGWTQGW